MNSWPQCISLHTFESVKQTRELNEINTIIPLHCGFPSRQCYRDHVLLAKTLIPPRRAVGSWFGFETQPAQFATLPPAFIIASPKVQPIHEFRTERFQDGAVSTIQVDAKIAAMCTT